SRSRTVSTLSRAGPGSPETITRSSPTSAVKRLDLPTLGRPRMATRSPAAPAGQRAHDRSEQAPRAVAGHRRDGNRVAEPESVEFEGGGVGLRVVHLVRDDDDRLA